ncbi:pyridoxal-dependent decarboxylase [Streptomyces sp. SID8352]|uniref:pyridoxal phosphate-dependent decarboxylase family protein n=1 Tax=Streptomyces sp. SID8352 TaxID=2690338 RepID=UPI00136E8BC3|nr:pyridoxal-dependent decarboxylase [Streptomyces sp. SID8352]
MLSKVGWQPPDSSGVLVHGGSLANLTALLAARARAFPSAWEQGTPAEAVILVPAGTHVSVARAASILGLGSRAVHPLPCDDLGRTRGERVAEAIELQHRAGRRVMAVIANACAPTTGLYDPLEAMATACRDKRVWLHVDAAHGGSALLVPELRTLLRGIEQADSVTWDAHKMLRTSTLAAAVLIRRSEDLHHALRQSADYLFFNDARTGPDLMHCTVEGSKAELGLKIFLNLAWRGEQGLAAYVHGRHQAARTLWRMVSARNTFEALSEPESNLVCFRYADGNDPHSEVRHIAIRDRLMGQGTFHLASSLVRNRRWWRATVMSPASDQAIFTQLLDTLEIAYQEASY